MTDPKRAFNNWQQRKQDRITALPGWLGMDNGVVEVPGRANYVYVRLVGQPIAEVFNNRVSPVIDLPVLVGYDPIQPQLFQVLSARAIPRAGESETSSHYGLQHHAITHEWMGVNGGDDPVMTDLRAFLPLRIGPGAGLGLDVYRGIVHTSGSGGGSWNVVDPAAYIDLSAYQPSAARKACFVMITLDTSGAIVATKGSEQDADVLALTDLPAIPADTDCILGAVRLYTGQVAIEESRISTDIVDLRFPMWHRHSAGGGGTIDLTRSIQLQSNAQDLIRFYPATSAGLDAASADAAGGDAIILPACTITGDHTLTANVSYVGISKDRCILTGEITLAASTSLDALTIHRTVNTSSVVKGVVMPVAGTASMTDSQVRIDQSGTGEVRCMCAEVDDANINTRNCYAWANTPIGVTGYALYVTAATTATIHAWHLQLAGATPLNQVTGIDTFDCSMELIPTNGFMGTPLFGTSAYITLKATAPAVTFPGMLWYDTTASALKMRNIADSAWITVGGGSGDMTKAEFATSGSAGLVDHAILANSAPWSGISGKPTTIAGFGITDAYSQLQLQTSGSAAVAWGNLTGVPSTFAPSAHNLLSTAHGDTTAGSAARGDLIAGQGATPKWGKLGLGAAGKILGSDGTDVLWRTLAEAGIQAAFGAQAANKVYAGPTSGSSSAAPTFRSLVAADIPGLPYLPESAMFLDVEQIPYGVGVNQVWGNDALRWFASTSKLMIGYATGSYGSANLSVNGTGWFEGEFTVNNARFYLRNPAHANGMTSNQPTDVWFMGLYDTHGAFMKGISDGDYTPLSLVGVVGATTTTKPAIILHAGKKSGTSWNAIAATEILLQAMNFGTYVFTILGSGASSISANYVPADDAPLMSVHNATGGKAPSLYDYYRWSSAYGSVAGGIRGSAQAAWGTLIWTTGELDIMVANRTVRGMYISSAGKTGLGGVSAPSYFLQVGTSTSNGNGAYVTNAGVWTNGSSRKFKTDYQTIDKAALLAKVRNLEIMNFRYKDSKERGISPFAEDFEDAFRFGGDPRYLAAGHVAGVALVAIQRLAEMIDDLKQQINQLQ